MLVDGSPYRSIWPVEGGRWAAIIDQTRLPHDFVIVHLESLDDVVSAIRGMQVRGAPLIGAAAAYGFCLALNREGVDCDLEAVGRRLLASRPTAVNLAWAVERMQRRLATVATPERLTAAAAEAAAICEQDVQTCEAIGEHGLELIRRIWRNRRDSSPVNILTHCNAGWLATVDWGTALAPVYKAAAAGIPVHVWVDETRPRNQGARLTAWELSAAGIDHHLIVDNAGGYLMQQGMVDLCLVGADRTAATGDVCNKIGTYLKALAAHDTGVPFFVALPGSTIDWQWTSGMATIPIEERSAREVQWVEGIDPSGRQTEVAIAPPGCPAVNPAFDVTPARLITGLITERGVCAADRDDLRRLYPERQ